MAHNKATYWLTTCPFCSTVGWLGMQDASRNQTKPTILPGPMTGNALHMDGSVMLTVSPKKWGNTHTCLLELYYLLTYNSLLPRLQLEQIRGFLIYITHTYTWTVPYLKGWHLPINSWWERCNIEGFKVQKPKMPPVHQLIWEWEYRTWIDERPSDAPLTNLTAVPPELVALVPCLHQDIDAVLQLFKWGSPSQGTSQSHSCLSFLPHGRCKQC